MKKLFLISMLFLFIGCGGGGDGGGGGSPPQTAPRINNVEIYDEFWNLDYSFIIGEYANFRVWATDPDLDMTTLLITTYYPFDAASPYRGPNPIALPSQAEPDLVYFTIDALETSGPAGNWRTEFQIEDSHGNDSNIFMLYLVIHEPD